jgi:hypothetical protein
MLRVDLIDSRLHVRIVLEHDLVTLEGLVSQCELHISALTGLLQLLVHLHEGIVARNLMSKHCIKQKSKRFCALYLVQFELLDKATAVITLRENTC